MSDPRGSIWRKWDLHIHTPASYLWRSGKRLSQMTSSERDQAFVEIVNAMNASDVSVFGIMDYWTFDGFVELRRFLARRSDVTLTKTVFPGIELRCDAPTDFSLNIHALLSDTLSDQQLADFKAALKLQLSDRPLSTEALTELPRLLAPDKIRKLSGTPVLPADDEERYVLGCKAARIDVGSLREAFRQVPDGTSLLYVPFDTYGGLEGLSWEEHPLAATRFMTEGHLFEVRRTGYADLFRGVRTEANTEFIDNFLQTLGGSPKPVVSGSDAHRVADYGRYPVDASGVLRCGWVKADCTFRGLIQAIAEPAARTYIGETPRHLTEVISRPTKYIRGVTIRKTPTASAAENWFDSYVPINQELVAIIGNKGSGKSALADILGLLGNSSNEKHFSFLNADKFRQPKANKAQDYEALLDWMAGPPVSKFLDCKVEAGDVAKVKYIPQNFLEIICTELGTGMTTAFDCEVKAVIFSHIPETKRLGKASLDELLEFRSQATQQAIDALKQHLVPLNARIGALEQRLMNEYRVGLQAKIRDKEMELDAHDASKPLELPVPSLDPATQVDMQKAGECIEEARKQLRQIEAQLSSNIAAQKTLNVHLATADSVAKKVATFERQFSQFVKDITPELTQLGLTVADIVTIAISDAAVVVKRAEHADSLAKLTADTDQDRADALPKRKAEAEDTIREAQKKLDGPAKAYEEYKTALAQWSARREAIIGSADVPDTLEFHRTLLAGLVTVPAELEQARNERFAITRSIYAELVKLADTYRTVYQPLHEFASTHPLIASGVGLNVDVSIREHGFADAFFARWNRAAVGSFAGAEEGARVLKSLLARHDIATEEGLVAFLTQLDDYMTRDHRSPDPPATRIASQLRKGHTPEALYEFIYSLEYLEPHYSLRLGEKELSGLSPGERGSLLLMFYLLIDRDDSPLIIDQPEENLDNQTVFTLLGACIKEAKSRRQIIIVTHNPNLAVACDAEQVIRAFHDPSSNPRIYYRSGAIENPEINRYVLDILEGTRPAFNNRHSKYMS